MIRNVAGITYNLTYKNVKNINLRIRKDLTVKVSANKNLPLEKIDGFVSSKAGWIQSTIKKISKKQVEYEEVNAKYTDSQCLELFNQISDRIYPLFSNFINKPLIKVRLMKSCWGVCHPKNYITLNKLLIAKPLLAIEYVIMHEYIHFFHLNHQKEFYDELAKYMPDYKERRKLLK